MSDYYLTENELAAYIEAQWLDKIAEEHRLKSKSRAVPNSFIQSEFFTVAPRLILDCLVECGLSPKTLLEVGPAVGRVNYELVSSLDSLQEVHVVEPSKRLLNSFTDILLTQGLSEFSYVSAFEKSQLLFDTTSFAAKYTDLIIETYNEPVSSELHTPECDLVVCLNVLDQCESPEQLVSFVMSKVQSGGVLALSCTYQWSKKHLKHPEEAVDDINQYFSDDWERLAEGDFEYKFRRNERYSMLFSSHTVIYKRK